MPTGGSPTDNLELFAQLAQLATTIGLADLFSIDSNGNPSGWLWDQVIGNQITEATFEFAVSQTDAFKRRYPAVAFLQSEAGAGRQSMAASIQAVRDYEDRARAMMQQAMLPAEFYDNNVDDLQSLIMKGISLVELEQRVGESWSRVQSAPPEVRQAFTDFYGVGNGDSALAAFFLDPTYMESNIDRMSRTAYTAGLGRAAGIGLTRTGAERVADLNVSTERIASGISELAGLNALFEEGVTETTDLTADVAGVEAVFSDNAEARSQLERRLIERQANRGVASGGAIQTNRGLIGTGTA